MATKKLASIKDDLTKLAEDIEKNDLDIAPLTDLSIAARKIREAVGVLETEEQTAHEREENQKKFESFGRR